jgi:hypothetical protein
MDDWIKSTPGVLSFMLVAVIILVYRVFMAGMVGFNYTNQYDRDGFDTGNQLNVYNQERSDNCTGNSSKFDLTNTGNPVSSNYGMSIRQRQAFLGGGEPPVFYDIGDIRAAQAMHSKAGYTYKAGTGDSGISHNSSDTDAIMNDSGGNAASAGYYYYKMEQDAKTKELLKKWYPCAPGTMTFENGKSCIKYYKDARGNDIPVAGAPSMEGMQNSGAKIAALEMNPY